MRVLVAGFHSSLALGLGFGAGVLLLQSRVNGVWEQGFYGELSPITSGLMLVPGLVMAMAVVGVLSSAAYAMRLPRAHLGLLAVSFPLVLILPAPFSWGVALTVMAVVIEQWAQLRMLLEEEEDDELDADQGP